MDSKRFHEVADQFSHKHVLVLGDMMLDTYMWGQANRISQEAPVPVVSIENISYNPGGAANVGWNIASLSANVTLAGIIGDDKNGDQLCEIISKRGLGVDCIIRDNDRPTTVKTRIIAHNQQVVRTDHELRSDISPHIKQQIMETISAVLNRIEGIIIADYNKGLLTEELINDVLSIAEDHDLPVYVDPKIDHFFSYKGVRFFKPNAVEFQQSMRVEQCNDKNGNTLRDKLNADIVMVTQGNEGIQLFTENGYSQIPTKARAVHDVSGAGDTVIAMFTLAELSGATPQEAAVLSNLAAGRVCEEVGVVPINLKMLTEILNHHHS